MQHCGAVVQLVVGSQRNAEHNYRAAAFRERREFLQGILGSGEKNLRVKQIAASVACNAQLRQHEQVDMGVVGALDQRANGRDVGVHIGYGDFRRSRRNLDKAIMHGVKPSFMKSSIIIQESGRESKKLHEKKEPKTEG